MEKKLRALMRKTLGTERYLSLVSQVYIRMIKAGLMRNKYPELFYIQQIVKPGDTCVDIGANVGYYSTMLSRVVGSEGKVLAVEPVKLFQDIFETNMRRFNCTNVSLLPVALGGAKGTITMGTPVIDGVFRHGLTHVVEPGEDISNLHTYSVEMQTPDALFASLTRLDFMKCDVEGYEVILMPYFTNILSKFKPNIQIELGSADHRQAIIELLAPLGYKPYKLLQNQLIALPLTEAITYDKGDFYFLQR